MKRFRRKSRRLLTAQEADSYNMRNTDQSAGAMPVAGGATSSQSYPIDPVFAAYRLPYPGTAGARDVGVCFEGEPAGGANPPAPPPTPPTGNPPADPPAPPATGDPADLGDAGKATLSKLRAELKAEADARKAAEKERDDLKLATASDSDKAIAAARKEAEDAVRKSGHDAIRREAVRGALAAAGINASVIDLAVHANEFAGLKVDDSWSVEGLDEAIKAFKATKADLFTKPAIPGSADGGARGTGKTVTRDQVKTMTPAEINAAFESGELDTLLKPTR